MATFRRFLLRLVHFFQPHRAESELERELAAHLGVLEDEYKRRGLTDAEARLAARRAFGGVAQAKDLHRDARSRGRHRRDGTAVCPRRFGTRRAGVRAHAGVVAIARRGAWRAGARDEPVRAGFNLLRRSRGRALLVVVQIGLAVVLLLGSALLIRSFLKLSSVDPGFATTRVLTFQVALSPNQPALRFSEELIARVQGLPGVRAAGYADHLPLTRSNLGHVHLSTRSQAGQSMNPPPPPPPPGVVGTPDFPITHLVSRDFLSALGVEVIEGRGFSEADPVGRPHSLLINRTLARSGFVGDNPVGTRVYTNGIPWDIIGIVEDARETRLADPPGPEIFVNLERTGSGGLFEHSSPYFAVRTDGSPTALVPAIREIVRQLDPQTAPDRIATMEQILSNSDRKSVV